MKKAYLTPKAEVHAYVNSTTIMAASRFSSTDGETFDKIKDDGDGEEEPSPMSKGHGWDLWEDE